MGCTDDECVYFVGLARAGEHAVGECGAVCGYFGYGDVPIHPLTHLRTHPLTHSLTHPLTHSVRTERKDSVACRRIASNPGTASHRVAYSTVSYDLLCEKLRNLPFLVLLLLSRLPGVIRVHRMASYRRRDSFLLLLYDMFLSRGGSSAHVA
jgi:hypothetical protein